MRKIYLWGAGNDCMSVLYSIFVFEQVVYGIIDENASESEDRSIAGVKVMPLSSVDLEDDIFIVISTRKYETEIRQYLESIGKQRLTDFAVYSDMERLGYVKEIVIKLREWIPNVEQMLIDNTMYYEAYFDQKTMGAAEFVLRSCANENEKTIQFGQFTIEYDNINDLGGIYKEILINKDYFFETTEAEPYIIDGGCNIGLAILYFKTLYPHCRIEAFEPNPKLYEIIRRNIERNAWDNIILHNTALDSQICKTVFYTSDSGAAGSLERRNGYGKENELVKIEVEVETLSKYIDRTVDFLKLDIEGAETRVLEEIENRLAYVKHMFIEFHEGHNKRHNYISKVLTILESAGFNVNIGKSEGFQIRTKTKPMLYVGENISEVLWAKNNN